MQDTTISQPETQNGARRSAGTEEGFRTVLADVTAALEQDGVEHVVIGGIASSVLGRPRTTRDIDVFLQPHAADPALAALDKHGFTTDRLDPNWIFKAYKDGVMVDVIFSTRYGVYLDEEMLRRSRIESFRGARVRVIAPEDLLVIKAIAHDEAAAKHWYDALGLLGDEALDWDYLLRRAQRGCRRVLSLLLYAQSIDYWVPERVIRTLMLRICER